MVDMTIFTDVEEQVQLGVMALATKTIAPTVGLIAGVVVVAATFKYILMGYELMLGKSEGETFTDFMKTGIKFCRNE